MLALRPRGPANLSAEDLREVEAEESADLREDLAAVRAAVAAHGERLARIEGALLGPARPPETEDRP